MMDFKKRALILTLAATVSVTGSFAAENYKNCLMNMEFQPVSENEIRLILNTKSNYVGSITPLRKDASTFIIMLPETDNQAYTPDLAKVQGAIESVEISKMPYANGSKGYTKILVKTSGVVNLNASTALYVPTAEELRAIEDKKRQEERKAQEERRRQEELAAKRTAERKAALERQAQQRAAQLNQNSQVERNYQPKPSSAAPITESTPVQEDIEETDTEKAQVPPISDDSSTQKYMIGLAALLIAIISAYIYIKGQEHMTNVMGESLKIDLTEDEESNSKKSKKKKREHRISRAVNTLDRTYKNSYKPDISEYTEAPKASEPEPEEEKNIVDLDALFKEKQSVEVEEETSALDDFLSGFSFDDEEESKEQQTSESENSLGFDEQVYENIINSQNLKFSEEDIVCFNELLQSEVSDDVIKNIDKYAVSNPIKHKRRPIDKILEKLVTDYTLSQNITFTNDDIEILKKLITVEIDPDFVTDLRTNPQLTKEMEKSISSGGTRKKPSEILTLNVKDMLPNLSEALKRQGRKPILSEAQPEVVYYSEGYDVDKLVLDFDLPDLSKEIKNKKAYIEKPSDPGIKVDQSYVNSVQKLKTTGLGLPDLQDVIAHPKKYAEPKKKEFVPDEKALLNNLMNVQFKPFDDGTRKFEIINDVEEEVQETANSISAADIQNEFRQFDNFELASQEDAEKNYNATDYDDFESLYKQDFVVDLDKNQSDLANIPVIDSVEQKDNAKEPVYEQDLANEPEIPILKVDGFMTESKSLPKKLKKVTEKFIPKDLNRKTHVVERSKNQENFEKLINIFEKFKAENKNNDVNNYGRRERNKVAKKVENIQPQPLVKCILDGINYDVVASAAIDENIGCHLVKSDNGYKVLSYKGSELSVVKEYSDLKGEKLFIRLSETLADGTPRYLVKAGASKFIAEVKDGQVRYVMDLC